MDALKKIEVLKHRLTATHDYSILSIFRTIDQYSHGKITSDNLRIFTSKFESCADLTDEDLGAFILRNDKDVDGGLNFLELVDALQAIARNQAPQQKMMQS